MADIIRRDHLIIFTVCFYGLLAIAVRAEDKLRVTVVNATAVRISWANQTLYSNNSSDVLQLNSSTYTIQFRNNETSEWTESQTFASSDVRTIVTQLQPYTEYQFQLMMQNESLLRSDWITTDMDAPSQVPGVNTTLVSADARFISFDIKPPPVTSWNGKLDGYILSYKNNDFGETLKRTIDNPKPETINITGLEPHTLYTVRLSAFNEAGEGPFVEFTVQTDEDVPSSPRIMHILNRTGTAVLIKWAAPEQKNGKLLGYQLYILWNEHRTSVNITSGHTNTYQVTGLMPYTAYDLQIAGYTSKGLGPSSDVYPVLTDVTAPSEPMDVHVTSNVTDCITVQWSSPLMVVHQVDRYYVRYEAVDEPLDQGERLIEDVNNSYDVYEVLLTSLNPATVYRVQVAAATESIISRSYYFKGPYSAVQEIQTLGESVLMSNMTIENDAYTTESVTASNTVVGVVIGVVSTVAIIIVGLVVIFLIRRYMQIRYHFIGDLDTIVVDKAPAVPNFRLSALYDARSCCHREAINVDLFEEHVSTLHADGDYLLSQEYEEINQISPPSSLSNSQSSADENKNKNRYLNILAYDHSRVVLKPLPGKLRTSDYINANYIDGYMKPKAYIATQGPLPSTFGDFWRMVWEQESIVIVMITKLMEKGRRKCDQYWPTEGEQTYEGGLTVHLLSTNVTAHYTVRMFSVRSAVKTIKKRYSSLMSSQQSVSERIVYQYHYTDWPDHGVPAYTLPSLAFVAKSTAANPPSAGPIIVHCSAGVGRTGTYIVLDSMMRQIRDIQTVNVFGFLSHIRSQRSYLVQTEDQYSFVHDALVEFIRSGGETEVKDVNVAQYVRLLTTPDDSGDTPLHAQYQLATSFEAKPFHFHSAQATVNESKNRSTTLLPVELARVHIPMKAGVEGSDYINASFLQGYSHNDEFIVTQHPLNDTVSDFWNMIWDQNSIGVVLLSAVDDTEFQKFWPEKDDPAKDFGHFHVSFQSYAEDGLYTSTDFLLQSTQDDYECVVKMIACPSWPAAFSPLRNVFELINKVKAWLAEHEQSQGPVIVIDKYGGVQAATFCALMTLYDALHHEACVDVYTVSKLYCMKRPSIWPTEEDYLFLYKAMESLCNDEETCVAGDRDSGIANCNNYLVGTHPPQPTSPKAEPSSPSNSSPAQPAADHSSPASQPGSPKSSSPVLQTADVPLELCSGTQNVPDLSLV